MIINNEYRSAVVNLLRMFSDEGLYDEFGDWCHSCGPGKLADLIESEPERTCHLVKTDHERETSYGCTGCKRIVLVGYKGYPKPSYCPNCGAKVVHK